MTDHYSGVCYTNEDGRPQEALRFKRWEEWVAWHDQRENEMQAQMQKAIGRFVRSELAPLLDRITQLELQLENFGYSGDWSEGCAYRRGAFVTLSGSMWHCNADETISRPDTHNPDWKLAVKRGRDAR
jgi:hypothetical protein